MERQNKRLGELLVDAGLITQAQLQNAITHQKIARGRIGSNLVALGYITEEELMDFLSHQTGVPRVDVRKVQIQPQVLKLVPRRLADQFNILPIAFKEPKSLVLAMSDPSDLNAIDSARFASGLHIEPMVATHSSIRQAIGELYRQIEGPSSPGTTVEVGLPMDPSDGLPVPISMEPLPVNIPPTPVENKFPAPDPAAASALDPFGLFDLPPMAAPPARPAPAPARPAAAAQPAAAPGIVHARSVEAQARPLETYGNRTLLLGLIKLFQRRGIILDNELQRYMQNLVDSGELKPDEPDPFH